MGKDKFGTKRGKCVACDECYEYTAASDGKSLACEYCDHKPIYHAEVVALGSCSCGKCAGYESANEFQYNTCDYCDCSADKHIGYSKVEAEIEKVKLRLNESRTGQISAPKTTESTVANVAQPKLLTDQQQQVTGIQMPAPQFGISPSIPEQNTRQYGMHANPSPGGYSMQYGQQSYPTPNQQPTYGQMASIPTPNQQPTYGQMASIPTPNQQPTYGQMASIPTPNQQSTYGQMASIPTPNQQSTYGQMASIPTPAQQYPTQQPSYGYPMQPSGMPRGLNPQNMYQPSYSQAGMQPPTAMPFSPTGPSGNFSVPFNTTGGAAGFQSPNICKNQGCTRPRRRKEDSSGHYDFCGKTCASQAK